MPSPSLLPLSRGGCRSKKPCSRADRIRRFTPDPITLIEASQLLWAAQGVTDQKRGLRSAPSAGALYPLEIYMAAGNVEGLIPGAYKYLPHSHELLPILTIDAREGLFCRAALSQPVIAKAPASLVIAAVYERVTVKYGQRGIQYVHMEAGHSGQNILLVAAAMGLGAVVVGAFDDAAVAKALSMDADEIPLIIIPVGRPK